MSILSKIINNKKRPAPNETGIKLFKYGYRGTIGGNSYTYTVDCEKKIFTYDFRDDKSEKTLSGTVGDGFISSLNGLYSEFKLYEWNGFDKYDPEICDGEGFSLDITFSDGEKLTACGMNAFPENYRAFKEKLNGIFGPEKEKLTPDDRR